MVASREREARDLFQRTRALSLWLDEALQQEGEAAFQESYRPLEGEQRCDVCIVGGGFLGLWTAIRLREADPGLSVAVVEKDICGAGASGRNGGFVLSWWAKYQSMEKYFGANQAVWLAKASEDSVDEIGAFCAEAGIGGQFRKAGWLWTSTGPLQDGAWESTLAAIAARGQSPLKEIGAEAAALAGSDRHRGGAFEETAATVQPALLARALAARARALGVAIYENSPMTELVRANPAKVRSTGGTMTAGKVIIAMNAWGIALPELRRSVAVVSSDVVASKPLGDWIARQAWSNGVAISDSRALVHYYRSTPEGRLVLGKGVAAGRMPFAGRVGRRFDGASLGADVVKRSITWLYPDLPADSWEANWMGPIDKSMSGLPSFGALPGHENILYGIGFSGNGVGPTNLGGRILASLTLNLKDEWGDCALVGSPTSDFPREPLRYVGAQMVRRALVRKEKLEDRGGRAGPLTEKLASLAPAALAPTASKS